MYLPGESDTGCRRDRRTAPGDLKIGQGDRDGIGDDSIGGGRWPEVTEDERVSKNLTGLYQARGNGFGEGQVELKEFMRPYVTSGTSRSGCT